ncbi:prolyl oligopeptidase family serine peptidase [Curtobacterium sp. B18]|uniref:prolyl oligopeptidase family serine peptidase n=1 Tax=Curtobacterium sp. B18 TaxID=95614 RepID=UPI0003471428|nr:prolyl oligopeptidase family serine peptidase [Curtobacterium sp. B18]
MTPLERREQLERFQREAEEARMAALEETRRREERLKAEASEEEKRRAEENKRAEEDRAKQAEVDAFFIGHSTDEFIPLWESQEFAATLRRHDVPVTFVAVEGSAHSIAQLDEAMSKRVVAFLHARLG